MAGFGVLACPLRCSVRVKTIGRTRSEIAALPSAQGVQDAVSQQRIGLAMAAVHSTDIAKGVYRFKTPQAAHAQRLEALVRVIAANAVRLRRGAGAV